MIKQCSFSSYILPVRDGRVAVLKYGENGYGPIGGRLDDGENFTDALRRELGEELGASATALVNTAFKVPQALFFSSYESIAGRITRCMGRRTPFFHCTYYGRREIKFL